MMLALCLWVSRVVGLSEVVCLEGECGFAGGVVAVKW